MKKCIGPDRRSETYASRERVLDAQQIIIFITICYYIIFIPQLVRSLGLKQEAKDKYHWRLEVRIFVSGTEGICNEDWVEALYNQREKLE